MVQLRVARYGKDKIRVFRIVRDGEWHRVVEYNVTALVEGNIETSYTQADNSVVVATDSIKNITYYLAKISPYILDPELFALHLGTHLVSKYAHLHKAFVTIEKLRWSRIPVDSRGHPHSFWRDSDEKRVTSVEVDASAGKDAIIAKVTSGISDLLVLKSTGSRFEDFIRDEYTTLIEVDDRILSTSIELSYTFFPVKIGAPADERRLEFVPPTWSVGEGGRDLIGDSWDGDAVADRARKATLEIFASDDSASVQATLYKMAQRVIDENARVSSVTYILPNKHYIPVNMEYIGVDNITPAKAEVFVPVAAPSGLITATISRA